MRYAEMDFWSKLLKQSKEDKVYGGVHSFKVHQQALARAQRKLSRKIKFSKNWIKQKRKVQIIHARIAHVRRNHLHQISTEICKNHAMIFIEDLKVVNMSRSAKGSREKPGKNVCAKSGLNRSILDQGWSELRRQLEYKSSWRGGYVIAVSPRYTSQCCSACGYRDQENRKTQAAFACLSCGLTLNADINAARNILAAGLCRDGLRIESHTRSETETCEVA